MTSKTARRRARLAAPSRRWLGQGLFAGAATVALGWLAHARETAPKPPLSVADWLHRPEEPAFPIPLDYVGLHSDHGLGKPVPPPDYPYDAIRSHDADDADDWPATQWARIERQPGVYDWRWVDAWFAAHRGKTCIWVLFGCPTFYQKYPGEPWRYPYLPGGGSPPREPSVAAAFVHALLARHPGKVQFVEIWNEPNFGWSRGGFDERWRPGMPQPGFFTGTPRDLAALARAVRAVLPAGVKLMAGAWESQSQRGPANSLMRFSLAPDGAGGHGRDHVSALSVHAYTYKDDPNTLIGELRDYRQRFAEAGYPPGLPLYVSEVGAEAPLYWTAERPPLARKVLTMKRWMMIPAALGYSGVYLYKHSYMRTLGDPAREPALARAIADSREALRGRNLSAAARLADDTLWLAFTDGTTIRA
jgi:hypothetical protein